MARIAPNGSAGTVWRRHSPCDTPEREPCVGCRGGPRQTAFPEALLCTPSRWKASRGHDASNQTRRPPMADSCNGAHRGFVAAELLGADRQGLRGRRFGRMGQSRIGRQRAGCVGPLELGAAESSPAWAAEEDMSGPVDCGPPPAAKPQHQTGGELFAPLPLPVTPLRRSEKKRPPTPPALIGKMAMVRPAGSPTTASAPNSATG